MVRHPTQVQLAMVRKTGGHRKEHRDQYTKADDRPALLETDGTNGRNIAKFISSTSHYIFPLSNLPFTRGLPEWLNGKESACQCRSHGFNPLKGKIPWRRKWQPTPVFFPGKSH